MASLTRKQLVWLGCALGAAYGVFARAMFALDKTSDLFAVMSSSFIFGVPVVLGFVTVWCGEYREGYGWARRVLTPWVASLACLGCCLALLWEGLICIWLWLPLVLILSSIGGLVAGVLRFLFPSRRSKTYCLAAVALDIPFPWFSPLCWNRVGARRHPRCGDRLLPHLSIESERGARSCLAGDSVRFERSRRTSSHLLSATCWVFPAD